MEYQEFKDCVVDALKKELQQNDQIEIHSIMKNNARKLDGLMVLREGTSIAPALYLNRYYEEYQKGSTLGSIVGEITDFYKVGRELGEGLDLDFYQDFSKVRDHIFFKLIHYETNKELLAQIPHIRTMDLAVTFYLRMEHEMLGNILIQIYNSHLKMWEKTTAQLYEIAMKNSPAQLPVELRSMREIVEEMIPEDPSEISREDRSLPQIDNELFVLTNYVRQFGAACILYPGVLSKFAMTIGNDFYLLPSSVHEMILVPARPQYCKEELVQMVQSVNATQLEPEEVLSDSVYFYSKRLRKIIY